MKAGWRKVPLGDVASFVMGQAPPGAACNFDGVGTPFVKAGEFGPERPIIREWTTDPKKFAKATDVLICVVGATCGKINLGADCAIGRSVAAIRPQPTTLDQFFLHYFLEGQVLALRSGSLGAAQTVISKDMLAELPIPLPPLDEQKRIVAVLDEAFEGLSRARANAEANLADARELFAVALKQSFSLAAAMSKGSVMQLGSAFETATGSTPPKSDTRNYGSFLPFVKPPELTDGEVFEAPDNLSTEGAALARVFPAGSVLVSCIGNLGKVGLATRTLTCNQQINVIKPNTAVALPEFMFFQALSPQFREQLNAASSGTTVPIVNKSKFNAIEIALPLLDAQREIVETLTSIQRDSRTLATDYQAKAEAIEWLRQSLLQKAFSGELT